MTQDEEEVGKILVSGSQGNVARVGGVIDDPDRIHRDEGEGERKGWRRNGAWLFVGKTQQEWGRLSKSHGQHAEERVRC